MNEKWVDITGYEDAYQVSDQGRVRSKDRVVNHPRHGKINRKGKILKPVNNTDGYPGVFLYKNGAMKRTPVHRLVADHFCDRPSGNVEVNHINENREDSRACNLEWISHKDNVRHGTGIKKRVEKQRKSVYCSDNKGSIYTFNSTVEAAKFFNTNRGEISRCCRGVIKTHHGMEFKYLEEVDLFGKNQNL